MEQNTNQDIHIEILGQDRIVCAGDIPLILKGYPRPLRDANRGIVWKDCVHMNGSEIVFLIKLKEVFRMSKNEFFRAGIKA